MASKKKGKVLVPPRDSEYDKVKKGVTDTLSEDVEKFLENGGEIQQLEPDETSLDHNTIGSSKAGSINLDRTEYGVNVDE